MPKERERIGENQPDAVAQECGSKKTRSGAALNILQGNPLVIEEI
jgi:hypothetical protein